jgi:hypothetical protein
MATKPLKRWSTDELESALNLETLNSIERYETERILRDRERAPDRKLARRSYNAAAWAEAYSMGTFIVALIILWLIATGEHLP